MAILDRWLDTPPERTAKNAKGNYLFGAVCGIAFGTYVGVAGLQEWPFEWNTVFFALILLFGSVVSMIQAYDARRAYHQARAAGRL
jgi:hypothetical protein